MTERLHFHFSLSCIREGNGNPLQCSCLENPRDGGIYLCNYLLSLVLLIFSCGFKLVTIVLLFQSEEFPLVLLVGRVWKWQILSFLSENVFNFSVGLCFIFKFQYVWNSWFIVFLFNTWNVTSWSSGLQRSDKKSAVHLIEAHCMWGVTFFLMLSRYHFVFQ